jgi:hypothetical protein
MSLSMKSDLLPLVIVFLLIGCSSTYRVSSPEEANRKIGQRDAKVVLTSGREYDARTILVRNDSISFIDGMSNEIQVVPTTDVLSIQTADRWGGALEGLMLGGLGGGVAGFALGSISSKGDQRGLGVALATFGGIAIGSVSGLIWGVLEGHQYTVEFVQDSLAVSGSSYFGGKSTQHYGTLRPNQRLKPARPNERKLHFGRSGGLTE